MANQMSVSSLSVMALDESRAGSIVVGLTDSDAEVQRVCKSRAKGMAAS